jgi:hypothetical protein
LVRSGLIKQTCALRSLGVWLTYDNNLAVSFQKKFFGATSIAQDIGALVRDGRISPAEAGTLAEERLWSRVRFSLELAICLPNWRKDACQQEAGWARAIIGAPKFVGSSAAVTGELGWCNRLVQEIESAALTRMARVRCMPPQRVLRRAVAGVSLMEGGALPGSWTAHVKALQDQLGIPDITQTPFYRMARNSAELATCVRNYRRQIVLPVLNQKNWQTWLRRGQDQRAAGVHLLTTDLQQGTTKLETLRSKEDWSLIRLRLGVPVLGVQSDGSLTRQTRAKCRLCGEWGKAHLRHVVIECTATQQYHPQAAREEPERSIAFVQFLKSRASEAAQLERLLQ